MYVHPPRSDHYRPAGKNFMGAMNEDRNDWDPRCDREDEWSAFQGPYAVLSAACSLGKNNDRVSVPQAARGRVVCAECSTFVVAAYRNHADRPHRLPEDRN